MICRSGEVIGFGAEDTGVGCITWVTVVGWLARPVHSTHIRPKQKNDLFPITEQNKLG